MKGVVFTEFMDMVDAEFGPSMTENLVDAVDPPSGCIYTAVGTYNHEELLSLVTELSQRTGTSVPDLVRTYGQHLFGRFVVRYPEFFSGVRDSFAFLESIDGTIHMEVHKLYPDAELPTFQCTRESDDHLIMVYRSRRPFADLAHGLIEGCATYFGDEIVIGRDDGQDGDFNVSRFNLRRTAAA